MYNFTLIIPTHNRHNYLKRSIEYFKDLDAKVIYSDSSVLSFSGKLYPNMEYLHLPGRKFADKVLIALDKITTDFVALCADDDFILIETLYKGVKLLTESNDFKTVVGKYLFFNKKFDGDFFQAYRTLPHDLIYDSKKNAELFFKNYWQILWALYDRSILKDSFSIIKKSNYSNDNFIELTIGAVACNTGGIKFMNDIWGVREHSANNQWGTRHKSISNIYDDINIKNDFKLFKSSLDRFAYSGYADWILKNYLKLSFIKKNKLILKALLRKIIPSDLIKYFKKKDEVELKNNNKVLEKIKLTHIEKLKLEKIKTILNNFE